MACSISIRRAQSVLRCQLCDENDDIQWKCLTCGYLICAKCRNIHQKVKSTNEHEIVDIKNIGLISADSTSGNVTEECKLHQGQRYCSFCRGCNEPVCPLCITREHRKHTIVEMKEQTHAMPPQSAIKLTIKNQYSTHISNIRNIVCSEDGSLWAYCSSSHELLHLDFKTGSIDFLKTFSTVVYDMALSPTGELFVCSGDHTLNVIDYTTRTLQRTKIAMQPLIPSSVYFSKTNELIVGVQDVGKAFVVDGIRQVIQMDMNGKRKMVYYLDHSQKPLFILPHRITVDNNNNLYVLDIISKDYVGKIIVLKQTGALLGLYDGHPNINDKNHPFKPKDLVATPLNNVIITDPHNHILHIINEKAKCVTYIDTKSFGIQLPWAIDINRDGYLVIGCSTYKRESENAKIYVVNISGV